MRSTHGCAGMSEPSPAILQISDLSVAYATLLRPLHALEDAEAGNGDPFALGHRALDRVEDRVHGLHSLLTPHRKPLGNGIDQFGLVHVFLRARRRIFRTTPEHFPGWWAIT